MTAREHDAGEDATPFVCTMSADSPINLDCSPTSGTLQPRSPPGQPQPSAPVHVHFTCRDFGKTIQGTLNVHTKALQYTFRVLGRQPTYLPPDLAATAPKVDTHLAPGLQEKLSSRKTIPSAKKNFQLSNITKTRSTGW
jgi:hypothetical protein